MALYYRYSPLTADLLAGNPLLQTGATPPTAAAMNGSGWCIFVYNLAPDTEENVLWQLFGPFGAVQVLDESLMPLVALRKPIVGSTGPRCKLGRFAKLQTFFNSLQ